MSTEMAQGKNDFKKRIHGKMSKKIYTCIYQKSSQELTVFLI